MPLEESTCGTPILNAVFNLKKNMKKTRKVSERSGLDDQRYRLPPYRMMVDRIRITCLQKRREAMLETLKTHAWCCD